MEQKKVSVSLHTALRKAEADLRLEGCPNPVWGQAIFKRVKAGHLSLEAARSEIRQYVVKHLAAK